MKEIINKIIEKVSDLLFPRGDQEKKAEELISQIAKLRREEKDRHFIYPCPAYSFFRYRIPCVRDMIWKLKYRGDLNVAKIFAVKMYDELCEELTELGQIANFREPILIPIPVSKKKLRSRGFNQSAAICKALANVDNNRFFVYNPNVLYKIKDTSSQARVKDKNERLKHLKDSFAVKDITSSKIDLCGRNIILLDDVLTTGSTLVEATRVLKCAGAKQITWVVVAH